MATTAQMIKRILVGKPIPSSEEHRTRLSKLVALPVFSSDAISSTAYATEEILIVLVARRGTPCFTSRFGSASLLPVFWPSWPSPISRPSTPTLRAAARTSSAPRTWAGSRG